MSRVHDPNFLTFAGEPITGRTPAKVVINGNNGILTPLQTAGLEKAYSIFRLNKKTAIGDYFTQTRRLPDGTTISMTSMMDVDRIIVTPPEVKTVTPETKLQPIELEGYVLLPKDDANINGWNAPGEADSARAYIATGAKLQTPVKLELHVKLRAGVVDWRGNNKIILSYDHNGNNRYHTSMWGTVFRGSPTDSASNGIYYKGTLINTPSGVSAAGVFGSRLLMISNGAIYATGSPLKNIDAELAKGRFVKEVSPTWAAVAVAGTVGAGVRASAWHFSPDGSKVVSAYVYASYGTGTWTLKRMRTEALPQAKRYVTFTIVAGELVATVSDTAYTTEPFAAYVDGGMVDGTVVTNAPGALTFAGRRLWGVDFDAEGNELVVSCRRTGSGSSTADTTPGAESYTLEMSTRWGVYVNENEVFRADYVLPQITITAGAPTTYIQTGVGVISAEYISMHALDARSKAAVVERLGMAYAAAATGCSVAEANALRLGSNHANAPYVVTPKLQVIFNGTVVAEHVESVDASLMVPMHADLNVSDLLTFYRYGQSWKRTGLVFFTGDSYRFLPQYPQIGDYDAENIYEWRYQTNGGALSRHQHTLFNNYPNQISDVLSRMYWLYSLQILTMKFNLHWDTARFGTFNSGSWFSPDSEFSGAFLQIGPTSALVQGLAVRQPDPLHFIASIKESYVNQFIDRMTRIKEQNAAAGITGVNPTHRASVFTRDTTGDAFVAADLRTAVKNAVTADGNAPNNDTFQINPVRVL